MSTSVKKRKICFIITSFIHYSRNLLILEELNNRSNVDFHVVIAGTALLSKYSAQGAYVEDMLKADGFKNLYEVHFNLEGSKLVVKAKTAGLGVIELSSLYNQIEPDIVVVRGDRFETLSAVIAASLMNIPIAHIEGGDVTGTIDESIRHAVTKLSHIHFATNEPARKRIIKMGERPEYVFNTGSPDIEVARKFARESLDNDALRRTGSGAHIDTDNAYLITSYHPVTTELEYLAENTRTILQALYELGIPTFWFWPNFDAGAEEKIARELRAFNDTTKDHKIKFMRYIPPKQYLALLKRAKCLVGNSSAGIKECSYLGVPVVNLGSRQEKRLRGDYVLDASHNKKEIINAIERQLKKGSYPSSRLYYKPNTSKKIADTLATIDLYIQKSFTE